MTIDKSRLPRIAGQKAPLPPFTPVPRAKIRHDGWTPERQRGFIEALADTGSVKAAAHRVNMTPEGAYLLRRHAAAASFRKAWEAALALGVQQLEDIAMERALYGTEVPVYSYGKLIGSRIVHNDRLLMFMLKNRAPTRFAADGRVLARGNTIGSPHHAAQLSRLKKQWRKEWEEEQRVANVVKGEEVIQTLNARLQRMADRRDAAMTAETRALYTAYQEAERADRAAGRTGLRHWTERLEGEDDAADAGEEAGSHPSPNRRIELSDYRQPTATDRNGAASKGQKP